MLDRAMNKLLAAMVKMISRETERRTTNPKGALTTTIRDIRGTFRDITLGIQKLCAIPNVKSIEEATQLGVNWKRHLDVGTINLALL